MNVPGSIRDHQGPSLSRAGFAAVQPWLEPHKHHLCRWLVIALCFASSCAHAQRSITLAWDRNTETNIAGYKLYYGTVSRVYTNSVNAGNATSASVTNLVAGLTYRFAVTAFNTAGVESDYSAEIAYAVTNVGTPNIPPTLASIANMTVGEDGGAHTVLLTGITSGGENQPLTVTASSTSPSLIPGIEVLYTSARTTGTLSFVTGPNLSGAGVINVTVSDGVAQTVRSFTVTVNAVNDAPTLASIPDQTTAEDAATPMISLTLADVDTAAANLTLSGTSSSLALVPNANIVFGGSGANRTVRVTPLANQFGTSTITVTASDGALSATRTFQLTVTSSNDPPTIASLPAATVPLNILTLLQPVVIADVDTAAASLVVTGTSSDTNILPNANIVLGTLGLSRTLSVRPLTAGSATVTLRVSDGIAQATQSFLLTVTNTVIPDLAPTLASIPNQTIAEDTATPAISFAVADLDTPVASLTLSGTSSNPTLAPNANIVFGGSGANRTVRVTPVANQFGTTTINVTVSDGALSASRTFQLTVTSSNDPPTIAALPAATVVPNTLTLLQPVVIGDIDTAAASLVVTGTSSDTTVLPNSAIVLGGTGSSRTLSVQPLKTGLATVTLRVTDGISQATQSFLLTATNSTGQFALRPSFNVSNGGFTISWESRVGYMYRVMTKTSLTQTAWIPLSNLIATNTTSSWTDLATGRQGLSVYKIEMAAPIRLED